MILYDKESVVMGVDGGGIYGYESWNKERKVLVDRDGGGGNVLNGNGLYRLWWDGFGDLWRGC